MAVTIPDFSNASYEAPPTAPTWGSRGGGINSGAWSRYDELMKRNQLANKRTTAYNAENDRLRLLQMEDQRQREAAVAGIDRAYASPERMAGMERLYGANLQNQLAGLQQGFRQTSQKTGLAAARRGRLGSSFDTEQQAGLQAGLRGDIMGAEQEAYGGLQSLRDTDEQQRLALRRAIMSGDPQAAAAFEGEARGYDIQRQGILSDAQLRDEARRRQQQQQSQNYQLLGDVLTSGGAGVQNYYRAKGY